MILCSRTANFNISSFLASWRHGSNPSYVMPGCLQRVHGVAGNIFISEKAHFTLRSDILFPISACLALRETCRKVVVGETWIVAQNILLIPAISHQANDEVDGKAGAANYWLTSQDCWIKNNARRIGHRFLLRLVV